MIIIGFNKKNKQHEIVDFLKDYDISIVSEKNFYIETLESHNTLLNQMSFFEIKTKYLSDNGLCCWGESHAINSLKGKKLKDPLLVQKFKNVINLYDMDVLLWMNFIHDFVNKQDELVLFRYYPDIDIPITIEKIISKEFTQELLLNMESNQIFIISKTEQKTGDG